MITIAGSSPSAGTSEGSGPTSREAVVEAWRSRFPDFVWKAEDAAIPAKIYDLLASFGDAELQWLESEFADECSDGDMIINNVLQLCRSEEHRDRRFVWKLCEAFSAQYLHAIYTSFGSYLQHVDPDPLWAD